MRDAKRQLDNEIEKAEMLIKEIAEIPAKLQNENPHWGDVGDVKRLNELLNEIIKIC